MAILARVGRVLRARLGDDSAVRDLLHELAVAVADEVADQLVERPRRAPLRPVPRVDDEEPADEVAMEKARARMAARGIR